MRLFRIFVDGALFYHPQLSKLAVTEAKVEEDAENIDSLRSPLHLTTPIFPPLSQWHL